MLSNMRYVPPKIQPKSRGMQGGTDELSKGHALAPSFPSTGPNLGGRGYGELGSGGVEPIAPGTPKFKRNRVRAF